MTISNFNLFRNLQGVVDFDAKVPEPATWALMIIGFGAAGVMIRRRRPVAA